MLCLKMYFVMFFCVFFTIQIPVGHHGTAVEMKINDFKDWEKGVSTAKYTKKPVLAQTASVQFRRGSSLIFWKYCLDSDEWQEGGFLKKKMAVELLGGRGFSCRTSPRGITIKKKMDLDSKLYPLMPDL